MPTETLTLGTRGSRLARWQARRIRERIEAAGVEVRTRVITTHGDRVQDVPLSEIGDEAIFTKEIDRALLAEEIDLAVHSLKDLPSRLPAGLALAAVGERANPFDAFVAHPDFDGTLADLPEGAIVATSSVRRRAQLKAWRADLEIVPVRGNVDTRLEKLDASTWCGMVLACAGLVRLGLSDRIQEEITPAIMIPAVGQGALAVVCRIDDAPMHVFLNETVHHAPSGLAVRAGRAFMQRLESGCQVPTGAWARIEEGRLVIDGCVAALDGSRLLHEQRHCPPEATEAEAIGYVLAESLLARGGHEILDAVRATT